MSNNSNKLKTVLVCGDSFGTDDPEYPDLHFTKKILNSTSPTFELHNLSHGGDSNALIALQLMQGLRFNPDFVILSFTSTHRHEFDHDEKVFYPRDVNYESLTEFRHNRYTTKHDNELHNLVNRWNAKAVSEDFEIIKNYFIVHYCFLLLEHHNIPFCYSLGGMAYRETLNYSSILDKNFVKNYLNNYSDQSLRINLWNHHCNCPSPCFHVDDNNVQTAFANECMHHLKLANII